VLSGRFPIIQFRPT